MRTSSALLGPANVLRAATTSLGSRLRAERGGALSLHQVAVLGAIVSLGPITPGELARRLRMLPQSLTRPLSSLEEAGLVTRTPDPTDGRGALLAATPAGRQAIADEFAPRTRWLAEAMAAVCDEDDLDTLARAAAVMDRLIAHGGGPVPVES